MLRNIVLITLFSFVLSSCIKGSSGNDVCNYDPCAVKASANEEQAIQIYLTNNGIQADKHCSGMYYKIETPGTGKKPNVCSYVTVNYVGTLTNGNKFDETTPITGPRSFPLTGVILGWQNGIPLINEGGRIRLFIPPSLGYGNQDRKDENGNLVIPAGSILIFDVELKQVR